MDQSFTYPRHAETKDSGVPWLGEIPLDWDITKLRYEMVLINGAAFKPSDWGHKGVPIIRIQNLNGSEDYNYVKGSKRIDPKYHIEKGDIVFSWSGNVGTSFGAFRWEKDFKAYLNQHIFKVTAFRNYSDRFLYWLLRAVTTEVESHTHGIFGLVHITKGKLGATLLPVVPEKTQEAIANFLDYKTVEIDETIAKKQRLIALLEEQKAILINQAVTKGLNPDAPMRDSGVKSVGEVPEHWQVIPNRYIFREANERSSKGEEIHLSMSQKFGLVPAKELEVLTLQSESYEGAKLCLEGDLVLNRLKAHLAVFSTAPCDGLVSPDYSVFRLQDSKNVSKYFEHLFKTPMYLTEFNKRVRGIVLGFYRLYSGDFKAIPCLLPPVKEQVQIMVRINEITDQVQKIQSGIVKEIAYIQEYKTTLIASAVTGKIKL